MFFECFAIDIKQLFHSPLYFSFINSVIFFEIQYKQSELIGLFCGKKKESLRAKDKKISLLIVRSFDIFPSSLSLPRNIGWRKKRVFQYCSNIFFKSWNGNLKGQVAVESCWLESDLIVSRLKYIPTYYYAYNNCNKCMFQYFDLTWERLLNLAVHLEAKINNFVSITL